MNKWVKIAAAVVGGLILLTVLAIGYMGFLPGVSDVLGTNKATDLGVKFTSADAETAASKLNKVMDTPGGSNVTLTDAEITAFINDKASKSDKIPFDNTQVKMGAGAIEITGNVDMAKLQRLGSSGNVDASSKSLIDTVTAYVKTDPSFDVKVAVDAKDGKPVVDITTFKLGNLSLPPDQAAAGSAMIESMLNDYLKDSGLSLSELQASNGQLTIATSKTP